MKLKIFLIFLATFIFSCAVNSRNLTFQSVGSKVNVTKEMVSSSELGKDILGNTRVIITVTPDGLNKINVFLKENFNKEMDIVFGSKVISSSVPIRTDHFGKDIIIPFQDLELAKEFQQEYGK